MKWAMGLATVVNRRNVHEIMKVNTTTTSLPPVQHILQMVQMALLLVSRAEIKRSLSARLIVTDDVLTRMRTQFGWVFGGVSCNTGRITRNVYAHKSAATKWYVHSCHDKSVAVDPCLGYWRYAVIRRHDWYWRKRRAVHLSSSRNVAPPNDGPPQLRLNSCVNQEKRLTTPRMPVDTDECL